MDKTGKMVRSRRPDDLRQSLLPEPYASSPQVPFKRVLPTPSSHIYAVLVLILAVLVTVIVVEKKLPQGLRLRNEHKYPNRFIAERAMNHLVNLTNIGPRTTGSYENEVLAVNIFVNEISNIMNNANGLHIIQLDKQKSSGAFQLAFLDGLTNVYRNVQSVVVKVGPRITSNHSLLINCHFDTVVDSPGGSDDGAGCAVMLEMLRVLSQSAQSLQHNIIFLFNGAEENLMQASHGFITQHKWAKEVRAFINLEACGAGGREVLFQAGPNSPWLMQAYAKSVPYPYTSSLAQDIFQSGIIPGETDFRIFRDFGHISGLDFAWSTNGYVYHTKFDTVNQIPLGSLQRTGDNILALAKGMASGHQLADLTQNSGENLVFFDFLGAFVVRWPDAYSNLINIVTLFLSLYSGYSNMKEATNQGLSRAVYFRQFFFTFTMVLSSWLLAFVFNLGVAMTVATLDRQMSWFARPLWLFVLYVVPTIFVPMILFLFAVRSQRKVIQSPWVLFQLYYDSAQAVWSLLLFLAVLLKVRSGFIALMWVFTASVGNLIRPCLFRHYRDSKWLLLHIATFSLPFVQCFYMILGSLNLFLPIMGRIGAAAPVELIAAALTASMFNLLFSFVTILIVLCRTPERIISILSGIFLISMALLILTPLGFPYSGDQNSPAPQRYMIVHTERIFHDANGSVRKHDAGYWFANMDVNSPKAARLFVPEINDAVYNPNACEEELYCGYPYLLPVTKFLWLTHWLPGPKPEVPIYASIMLHNKTNLLHNIKRYSFTVTGPVQMALMLSPKPEALVQGWSFDPETPLKGVPFNGRDTYFVYYCSASDAVPWNFHIDFKMKNSSMATELASIVDISVVGHFMQGPHKVSREFKQFIDKFPVWATINAWTSTYQSYVF